MGVRQVRTKAAEGCFGNAVVERACLADVSCQTRPVECSSANEAFAN